MKQPLYVLDGYAIIYRSYYAFINRPLVNAQGMNISAVFGFFKTLFSFFKQYTPDNFVVALDSIGPTFRHENYKEYKANRSATPEDLKAQFPVIEEILDALKVPSIRVNGFEADDIIGTFAKACEEEERECYIISGDKDLMQLISERVKLLRPDGKGGYTTYGPKEVEEEKGVGPEMIIDLLSLMGDTADNIPGVAGIGPKTACKLLLEYGSLDGIYENVDKIKAKGQRTRIEEGKEDAYTSKDLVIIKTDVDMALTPEECVLPERDGKAASELFLKYGIGSLGAPGARAEKAPVAKKGVYEAVVTEELFVKVLREAKEAGIFAFDVETDNIDAIDADPVGFCISWKEETGYYIPLKAAEAECLSEEIIKAPLKELLESPEVQVVGQNFKYDYKVLKRWGIEVCNISFDTMVAAWILDSSLRSYSMDFLAEKYLNYTTVHFKDIVPKGETFDAVPLDQATVYAAEDADITLRLYNRFKEELEKEEELKKLFYEVEMPVLKILASMEREGITLDAESLKVFEKEIDGALASLEDEIYMLCGKQFNIKSTKQLAEVLFTDRKLNPVKKTKTGYSTDTKVLEVLAKEDPVPEKIIEHRGLSKLKSTYVEALPKLINKRTGKLHTHFLQTGTATGRFSCKEPNLQNIPVRDERGRRIRTAFIPGKDKVFLSADYSQIELVVLAHLSGDPALVAAYKEGRDIHKQTASLIYGVDSEAVTAEMRRVSKMINFGVMYGMSAFRLSGELGISRKDASDFIKAYFTEYAGVKEFMDTTLDKAQETGYVETVLGRRRILPGINSSNKMEKAGAERAAVNSVVQGTAADIMKLAMINIASKIKESCPRSHLVLQVHDEFIFEAHKEEVDALKILVQKEMEEALALKVPLRVSVETGQSWGEIH